MCSYYTLLGICCIFSRISVKPQNVWGLIVSLPLYQFSASCHAQLTLWAWKHVGIIFVNNCKWLCECFSYPTELVTKMHPYTTFLYTLRYLDKHLYALAMATFTPWQKTNQIFEISYLGAVQLKLGTWVLTVEGICTAKIVQFCKTSTKLCMHENHINVLP